MNNHPCVLRIAHFSFLCRPRSLLIAGLLLVVCVVLALTSISLGTLRFSMWEVMHSLLGNSDNAMANQVIWRIRLPRVLTALLVGACLGSAGAIFQSISRNVLGSPDIIGFTTGAATGAIVQIIVFDAGPIATALAAIVSGIATALLVFLLSMHNRRTGGYRLILVGLGVGATLSGVNTILLSMGKLDLALSAQIWLAGSLNTRTWAHVLPVTIAFVVLMPLIGYYAKRLDILEMGDETASQLGVMTERVRLIMVLAAVCLTAVATAVTGPIAFIALAAPVLARRLTASAKPPLFTAAMMGAVLLISADLLSQHLPLNLNLPIGLTTGFLGGFYLLWLVVSKSARH